MNRGRIVKRDKIRRIRRRSTRRGVTLVEMLVTLAILLIMMTVIVKVFQAATGALNSAQAYQELDNQLRRLESVIRADLRGVTARFTPPLNPKDNLGYFEYGENAFADLQGEDSDDYIRFTAKAPAGKPFVGRVYIAPPILIANMTAQQLQYYYSTQPVAVTSDYAEIIYFLRNGNLYRRVLLVAPERQASIMQAANGATFVTGALGTSQTVSWQGVNDLSARPALRGPNSVAGQAAQPIVLNSLGDLTNRENRFANPRFADDFIIDATGAAGTDGIADDANADGIPDFYPTLYYNILPSNTPANPLIFAQGYTAPTGASYATMAFPYVFPGAYTTPETATGSGEGRLHSPTPSVGNPPVSFDANPVLYLRSFNHNPLDVGDNLPTPALPSETQTWWGFPTWRETLSPNWADPTVQVNTSGGQPLQLNPIPPDTAFPVIDNIYGTQLLPPMTLTYRAVPQLFTDGAGGSSQIVTGGGQTLWPISWEDDLIMTNVRSFDIKAYDNSLAIYADLGWGDDARLTSSLTPQYLGILSAVGTTAQQVPYLTGNLDVPSSNANSAPTYASPAFAFVNGGQYDLINQTFAHEGRIPPLFNDNRFDAQYEASYYPGYTYTGNLGDNSTTTIRLRRVWDTWSTDYTNAPAVAIDNANASNSFPAGVPWGPPFQPPLYPSYPPPYPAPLLGIQIQIRVVDPTNQRIKSLTIRQDFTDKL